MAILIPVLVALLVGGLAGFYIRYVTGGRLLRNAEAKSEELIARAEAEIKNRKRELELEAKENSLRLKASLESENRERQGQLQQQEERLAQKENNMERKLAFLEKKEEVVSAREGVIGEKEKALGLKEKELETVIEEEKQRLSRMAELSRDEARRVLIARMEDDARKEAARRLRRIEEETREEATRKSREIILEAIQRCASEHAESSSTSVVSLPSDEMKGRLIGREGRNIRAFEAATGVDLIVDDTPEAVTISAFNIYRREIARLSLERLIGDGRIHPARIEEVVEKVQGEIEDEIMRVGREAALSLGIPKLHPEIIRLLGKLKFRTSYGQNALQHSVEVAHLASVMAGELRMDQAIARRAGLIHDIGKSVDQEMEGDHIELGAELAGRYGEPPEVLEAIRGHHDDYSPTTLYAALIGAADALSASRPGARRETLEGYIKRLEKLEAIAAGFRGVSQAYAISAGREVRVIVKPEAAGDEESALLAGQISKKVEEGMEYPGTIKVTVIREARYTSLAR